MIREVNEKDLAGLIKLYQQLHGSKVCVNDNELQKLWASIMQDKNHHIVVAEENREIISSCVCVIIPNLTHNQQPYALIENVITDIEYRNKGLATKCLDFARDIAKENNCYKIMLLTGSKEESTLNFYRKAGYNSVDKTAFIQWL